MNSPTYYQPDFSERPRIAVLGGGTGTSNQVAEFVGCADVTAIVTMGDTGGSTDRLRRQFGLLPMGDLRNVLASMSIDEDIVSKRGYVQGRFAETTTLETVEERAEMFLDRLETNCPTLPHRESSYATTIMKRTVAMAAQVREQEGTLGGHNLGNLALATLMLDHERATDAVDLWGRWTGARGRVLPVTEMPHDLVLRDGGTVTRDQHRIDEYEVRNPYTATLDLEGDPRITPEAQRAIAEADAAILAPGSMFTSLSAVLGIGGMAEALMEMRQSGGLFIAVGNLVLGRDTTGAPHIPSMDAVQVARKLGQEAGGFTHVLANTNFRPLPSERIMPPGTPLPSDTFQLLEGHFAGEAAQYDPNDAIARSCRAHDAKAVWRTIAGVIASLRRPLAPVLTR